MIADMDANMRACRYVELQCNKKHEFVLIQACSPLASSRARGFGSPIRICKLESDINGLNE